DVDLALAAVVDGVLGGPDRLAVDRDVRLVGVPVLGGHALELVQGHVAGRDGRRLRLHRGGRTAGGRERSGAAEQRRAQHDGAGKTTAVRVLATLVAPDAGSASVCGYDVASEPRRVRERIGLTGQFASVDETLTGTQNLVMIGRLLDLPAREARARARELLD